MATVTDAREFKNGCQLAAWLGLVSTQHSSGGHVRQIWAMLAHHVDYDPHACLAHPMHRQIQPA